MKEFIFIGVYAVSCLGINRVIYWPVWIGIGLLVVFFVGFDVVLKKVEQRMTETKNQNKINVQHCRPESEMEIQTVNVEVKVVQNKNKHES